jgi:hypothetical protein
LVRTTLTIDDALASDLKDLAHREGLPFKVVVDRTLRAGLQQLAKAPRRRPYRAPTFAMGQPRVPLDKALALATSLEDAEVARKLVLRK